MSTTLVRPEIRTPAGVGRGGRGFDGNDAGGNGDGGGDRPGSRHDTYLTAIWILMIPVVMLFVGLTSAMVVRKGMSEDWAATQLPGLLYLNTLVLIASSITIELSRRALAGASEERFRSLLTLTAALGGLFLCGQWVAWRDLVSQGVFLSSNPSSAFFYVLTGAHAVHLVGGVAALLYLAARALRREFTPRRRSAFRAASIYWHFMDGLWMYLLSLLILWR